MFFVQLSDGGMDDTGKVVRVLERVVGQAMPLEVAPGALSDRDSVRNSASCSRAATNEDRPAMTPAQQTSAPT